MIIEEVNQVDPNSSLPNIDSETESTPSENPVLDSSQPAESEVFIELTSDKPLSADALEQPSSEVVVESIENNELITSLKSEIAQLKAELANKVQENDLLNGQYRRIVADFDNFRKRTSKEAEEIAEKVKKDTINELLPVVDNFERAKKQLKPQNEGETNLHKSYQSVYKQLVECLKRVGVSPMRAEGKEFDPNLHEAVMREATDQYPEGTVIEELQWGYFIGDRVLRHALVKVAVPPEPGSSSESSSSDDVSEEVSNPEG